jgi:uncharacterized protein
MYGGMMSALPMFPLGTVLFPHVGLPLRIFEIRYREMLQVCLAGDSTFGVVLIADGIEVGGADDRFEVGTIARIVHCEVEDDGQARIVAVGTDRFRVNRWADGTLYPQADIEVFADSDEAIGAEVEAMTKRVRRLLAKRTEMNLDAPPATIELHDDPSVCLWQLCALVPAEPHDDLALLSTTGAAARLDLLGRLLDQADDKTNKLLGR